MIGGEFVAALRTLFSTKEQITAWVEAARTAETRARILHWSRVENVGILSTVVSGLLLGAVPFLSGAIGIWSAVDGVDRGIVHGVIWGTAIVLFLCAAVLWGVASTRREGACYADGQVTVGLVERAIEHPGSGDDETWFDLRITAELSDGRTLRRRLHLTGEDEGRRLGGPIRFRYNTVDPDNLDDISLVGLRAD